MNYFVKASSFVKNVLTNRLEMTNLVRWLE